VELGDVVAPQRLHREDVLARPSATASSSFQPNPIPRTKRPCDCVDKVATAFAVTIGSRWATRQIPVPTTNWSVTAAAIASATNGSSVRLYSSRRSASPVGGGVVRLVGMCVCSGT
jgi:hypothetical protein